MLRLRFPHRASGRARAAALVGVAGVCAVVPGCGSSSSSVAPRTGRLTVTVSAPAGVTPSVTVTGPAGYRQVVTATETLTGLAAGSYTIAATPVFIAAPIVGTAYDGAVLGSPANVTASAKDTARVSYALRPGSGGLWVVNFVPSPTADEYSAAQLAASTSGAPTTALATGSSSDFGAAFDAKGNLWVTQFTGNAIVEYTASQLGSSGAPAPAVTLNASAGSLNGVAGLAFDASGNLWVANTVSSTVVEFTTGQLASSGSPTPAVTLSANGGSLNVPTGVAFDAGNNLWVVNAADSSAVEFTPSQYATTGAPAPAVMLTSNAGSLRGPLGLAFDKAGDLWVSDGNTGANRIAEFGPSQLSASGSPVPAVTLAANGASLSVPTGLAFDESGNLWVANGGGASVVEFAASQLVASGAPSANVAITGSSLTAPAGIAFAPPSAALPLK
jgi:hypothetical protein